MARPERHDADYFPFYVKDGKTLFILESKYGLQGIGFFTNLMRFLCKQPDHHICIQEESDRLYFFAQIRCQEDTGMDMLNLMAKTGKIDATLWNEKRVIVSDDLLESLKDAYKNRNNPIIIIDQIRVSYQSNQITSSDNPITSPDNPQRKGKETKRKETKEEKKPLPPKTKFLDSVFLTEPEHKKLQEVLGQKSLEIGIEKLDYSITVKSGKYKDHYKTLLNWFKRGYLVEGGNGNGSGHSISSRPTFTKTSGAQSDGQPYPADREY
jgi:hypothetical protein